MAQNRLHSTALTGAAGEHFVMYRLLSLGYVAGLAPQGAPNVDIVVTDPTAKRSVGIQVKTRLPKGSDKGWHMSQKHEDMMEENLFYCLVDLSADTTVYVVPSGVVAEAVRESHRAWLSLPGKNGQPHRDSNVRRLLPDYSSLVKSDHPMLRKYSAGWLDEYEEAWDVLGLD